MREDDYICTECGIKKGRHSHPDYTGGKICDDCIIQIFELKVEELEEEFEDIKKDIAARAKP